MCSPCHANCLTCGVPFSEYQCLSCRPAGNYPFLAAERCVASCQLPFVQYIVGSALQCLIECPIGTFKQTEGNTAQCSSTCPAGYYPDSSSQSCASCHSSCLSCSGPLPSNCLSCTSATPFIAANSTCLVACSSPFYSLSNVDGSRCVHTCPKLHYSMNGYRYCVDVCMEGYYRVGWQCFTQVETLTWGSIILIIIIVLIVLACCIFGGHHAHKKWKKHQKKKHQKEQLAAELQQPLINPPSD